MHLATCFGPAALSGLLWNLGFVGITLALVPPWGLSVGGPSTQVRCVALTHSVCTLRTYCCSLAVTIG